MDLTELWVFWHKRQNLFLQGIVALLLVGVGYQVGRVTSPYYAASPIIFQDRNCTDCKSSGGTETELKNLQEEGSALAKKPTPIPSPTTTAVTSSESEVFVASVNSTLFHYKDCPSVARIKPENQVWFATAEAAKAAGYSPSQCATDNIDKTK